MGIEGGTLLVAPVRLSLDEDRHIWRRGRFVLDSRDDLRGIPGFAAQAEPTRDDPSDRGRVYPQHILESVYTDRWTILTRAPGTPPPVCLGNGQARLPYERLQAVELWRFAEARFRHRVESIESRALRGRDALAVVHFAGVLDQGHLRAVTSRAEQNDLADELNRLLAPFAHVVPERARELQFTARRPPWRRARSFAWRRNRWAMEIQEFVRRSEPARSCSMTAAPRPDHHIAVGPDQPAAARQLELAPLDGRSLAEASEMPYVVCFAPGSAERQDAADLLDRAAPLTGTLSQADQERQAVLRSAGRAAVVFPDAAAVSYRQDTRPDYLPAQGTDWAIRTCVTDAVLLRSAQRLYFEDASTRLRNTDATTHPNAALRLHRDILSHRARLWWPTVAREPWVQAIDQRLAETWHLHEVAAETFEETDQLAAEADQAAMRWLTWTLLALAAMTLLLQVPGAVGAGAILEVSVIVTAFLLLILIGVAALGRRRLRR